MLGRVTRSSLLPLGALLLLSIWLTWPTVVTLRTHVVDRQDPLLNAWIMAWEARALLVDPAGLFNTNIFVPLHNTLAFSELVLSTSALVMPLQWLAGDALLAYNVAFLLSFATTAVGAYLLALYLTGHRGAAMVAAVAFTWAPYRLGHLSQIQLLAFGWFPLALVYLDRLLRGRGRPAKNGLLFGLFFLLQALSSFYYALFSAVAAALYVGGWVLWRRGFDRGALAGGALAIALVALVMLPLALPYLEINERLGAGWTLEQNERFSASLQAYLYAPEGSLLWGDLTRRFRYVYGACCPPDTLFPGLTLLALGAIAIVGRGGRRGLLLLLGAVAFLLSLGPTLTVRALEPTGITLPYRWLWEHVPGFDALRAPVRWAVLVSLSLSMLAALGLARLPWRGAWPVALALVLLEFAVVPIRVVTAPEPPPSLAWLESQPPTGVLELPLVADRPVEPAPSDRPRLAWERSRLLETQYFSTRHWHATPDGYSGYVPERHGDIARELRAFPSERSVALLGGLGVRYVVVDRDEFELPEPLPPTVDPVAEFDNEIVLEFPNPAGRTMPSTRLLISELPATRRVELPVVLEHEDYFVPVEGEPARFEVRWRDESGQVVHRGVSDVPWPVVVDRIAVMSLPVTTPPPGTWRLEIEGRFRSVGAILFATDVPVTADAAPPAIPLAVELAAPPRIDRNTMEVRWRALQPLERHYSLSLRVVDGNGAVVASRDGPPDEQVETIDWRPGEEYGARWTLDLPDGVVISPDRLRLIWYDPENGRPLPIWDGDEFVTELRPR